MRWPFDRRVDAAHAWGVIAVGTAVLVGIPAVLATLHATDSQFRWWWPTNWMAVPSVIFFAGCLLVAVPVRRSPAQGAIADQSALKVAKEQLAIEQARRYKEMEERGEPALEGRVVASPDDDGTGRARLEIQLMNAVELTSMVVIFRAGCPVNPYAATRVMSENRRPFPDGGNTVIKMGFPAHWRVHIVGDLEPFTLEVMARGDYGKSWDSLRVRVTFDDWTPPAAPRRSIPVQVRRSIRGWIRLPLGGRARKAIGAGSR